MRLYHQRKREQALGMTAINRRNLFHFNARLSRRAISSPARYDDQHRVALTTGSLFALVGGLSRWRDISAS